MHEKRTILVTNRKTGEEYSFKNRTEFAGRAGNGGWLQEYNKKHSLNLEPGDFIIKDIQRADPVEKAFKSIDYSIKRLQRKLGFDSYYGYIGKGNSFRVGLSTMQPYKGQRQAAVRPLLIGPIEEYLQKQHHAELVYGIEADDACSIDSYEAFQKWKKSRLDEDKLVLIAVDKDAYTTSCHLYNPNLDEGIVTIDGFGQLYIDANGKVRGCGRLWFYFFLLNGDDIDNYWPTYLCKTPMGPKTAYKALVNCKTDKEALQVVTGFYKKWYPNPFTYDSWQGGVISATWVDVLQEIWTMAHMLRWEGDTVNVRVLLDKMGLDSG